MLADVIDNDSWRLWPGGDRRLQLDKQFYRDLPEVTDADLKLLKEKFASVIEKLGVKWIILFFGKIFIDFCFLCQKFIIPPKGRIVVIAGSTSDEKHISKILAAAQQFGVPCVVRISSAHKATLETLQIAAEYESKILCTIPAKICIN